MIHDDMDNYERVKEWRKKNRARYNLYQRNRRKGLKINPVQVAESDGAGEAHAIPEGRTVGSSPATGATTTMDYLKELERKERERVVDAPAAPPAKFGTYRDDGGRPITERAWNALQELKKKAQEKEYYVDEYIQ